MGRSNTHVLNFPGPTRSRCRLVLAAVLLFCCFPLAFYNLIPSFTHATDEMVAAIVMRLHESPCAPEVGSVHCCALFLDAAPCVDECRKLHVDRVTFRETREFDVCAEGCRVGLGEAGCGV
jgi:hypothetical protein